MLVGDELGGCISGSCSGAIFNLQYASCLHPSILLPLSSLLPFFLSSMAFRRRETETERGRRDYVNLCES